MMHAPIYGSQINPPAKLFKRFTYDQTLKVPMGVKSDSELTTDMVLELNAYKTFHSFMYVEASDYTEGTHQPLNGLLVPKGDLSIKFNGACFKRKIEPCDPNYPETGDLVLMRGELWQISEGIIKSRFKSYADLAVFTLPLKKLL